MSKNSIDALAGLWWSLVIYIEEVRPVHNSTMWNRDCASTVWKDLASCTTVIQYVDGSDLAVTETICCIGKFYRDVGALVVCIELRAICQNIVHEVLTGSKREKLVDDDPLVVPPHLALRLAKDFCLLYALVSQMVDNRVMKFQEGQVKLRNDQVNVIARITE